MSSQPFDAYLLEAKKRYTTAITGLADHVLLLAAGAITSEGEGATFCVRNVGSEYLLRDSLAIAERSGCVLHLVEVSVLEAKVQAWSSRDAYRDRLPPPRRHWLLRWYDLFA